MARTPCNKAGTGPEPAFPDLLEAGRHAVAAAVAAVAADARSGPLLAVDATCGNGHDTAFLAETLSRLAAGKRFAILALDVQQAALDKAAALLSRLLPGGCAPVTFIRTGHEHLGAVLARETAVLAAQGPPEAALAAVMYNLGFLPGSDKRVITSESSTLLSLAAAADALAPLGLLAVHAYGGHQGGLRELEAVDAWCAALPFDRWLVARYTMANKRRNPEVLHLAWKRDRQ